MESKVLGKELFNKWRNQKSDEILAKVDKEKVTTEEMLVLSLHHMNTEFHEEFQRIDKRFEKLESNLRWAFSLFITSQIGIWLKLILS